MKKRGRRLLAAPITVLFFVGLICTDRTGEAAVTLLAALLHECGHLLAARWMKIPLRSMRIDLLGARLDVGDRLLPYGEEWLLAASGPLASLLFAALACPLWHRFSLAFVFSAVSLLLGLLNLLPVGSFDGGRMTEALLARTLGAKKAYFIVSLLTLSALLLLWLFSVYLLLRAGGGLSLFCFSVNLLSRFLECGKIG